MEAEMLEKLHFLRMENGLFEQDAAHYISAPQLAWNTMLKKRGQVDIIHDWAMYLMIERGLMGCRWHAPHAWCESKHGASGKCQPRANKEVHRGVREKSLWLRDVAIPALSSHLLRGAWDPVAHPIRRTPLTREIPTSSWVIWNWAQLSHEDNDKPLATERLDVQEEMWAPGPAPPRLRRDEISHARHCGLESGGKEDLRDWVYQTEIFIGPWDADHKS